MGYVYKNATSCRWTCIAYGLFVTIIMILMAGCATNPGPGLPGHATATPTVFSWQTLEQRPLLLPSLRPGVPCPTTHGHRVLPGFEPLLGNGPAYADFFGDSNNEQGILGYADAHTFTRGLGKWGGQKVLWFINPSYRGPTLVRGRQLDGPGMIRFTNDASSFSDHTLLTELRLSPADVGGTPWPNGGAYTRLQAPGCYAYQVDGPTFSYLIIFKAIPVHISPSKA